MCNANLFSFTVTTTIQHYKVELEQKVKLKQQNFQNHTNLNCSKEQQNIKGKNAAYAQKSII